MGDSIVALSTPPGTSGLAIVRVSGPAARSLIEIHFGRRDPVARHVYYGAFREGLVAGVAVGRGASERSIAEKSVAGSARWGPEVAADKSSGFGAGIAGDVGAGSAGPGSKAAGEILDRVNYVFFAAPASSTGEDVLEIYPHGNPLLLERVLRALLRHREARLAGPGEFTRRGFENGKIDLLQAEAVGQLIHAQTVEALKNAQRIAAGDLSAPLRALRDSLVDLSVRLELDVDFAEEEADPDYASWIPRLETMAAALAKLSAGFEKGRGLARAPRVVILGAPNAGKSSLINALVEEDRLLVSDIPGTTRDWVEVTLMLPGGRVQLVDTAGLGRPVDDLDGLAMERTRRQRDRADIRVWVEDGAAAEESAGATPAVRRGETDAGASGGSTDGVEADLRVATKADLPAFRAPSGYLAVSSRSHAGLEALRARLNELAFRDRGTGEDIVLTTQRQFHAIEAARERVQAALEGMRGRPAIEILAFEIREAAGHLRELLGEISSEEILSKLFSGFCIGK